MSSMNAKPTSEPEGEEDVGDAILATLAKDFSELRQHIPAQENQQKHNGEPHHIVGKRQQQRNMKK